VSTESQQVQQKKKMGRPPKFDDEFRRTALERMSASDDITALARELKVSRVQLYRWRNESLGRVPVPRSSAELEQKREQRQQRRVAELERLVARQAVELDFFKGALLRIKESRRKREQTSGTPSTSKSGK
jgi:transposase